MPLTYPILAYILGRTLGASLVLDQSRNPIAYILPIFLQSLHSIALRTSRIVLVYTQSAY